MEYRYYGKNKEIVLIDSADLLMTDPQSALDLLMTVRYETGCSKLVLRKESIDGGFFILSTGLAGEILQKFINYHAKLAVVGDFSGYTSKPLQDFIRECNRGKDIFFVSSLEEAAEKLGRV